MAKIRIARVLHQDEAFLTLEVPLDENRELRVEDGDRFYSFIFVRSVPDEETGRIKVQDWDPFGEDADADG